VRRLLASNQIVSGDYAARAAIPSDILYDPSNGSLAFSTAGPVHALLFVFTTTPLALEGSWASSHALSCRRGARVPSARVGVESPKPWRPRLSKHRGALPRVTCRIESEGVAT
jgi:hypothetical protein